MAYASIRLYASNRRNLGKLVFEKRDVDGRYKGIVTPLNDCLVPFGNEISALYLINTNHASIEYIYLNNLPLTRLLRTTIIPVLRFPFVLVFPTSSLEPFLCSKPLKVGRCRLTTWWNSRERGRFCRRTDQFFSRRISAVETFKTRRRRSSMEETVEDRSHRRRLVVWRTGPIQLYPRWNIESLARYRPCARYRRASSRSEENVSARITRASEPRAKIFATSHGKPLSHSPIYSLSWLFFRPTTSTLAFFHVSPPSGKLYATRKFLRETTFQWTGDICVFLSPKNIPSLILQRRLTCFWGRRFERFHNLHYENSTGVLFSVEIYLIEKKDSAASIHSQRCFYEIFDCFYGNRFYRKIKSFWFFFSRA